MTIKIIDHDGTEYEFDKYREPEEGEPILRANGEIRRARAGVPGQMFQMVLRPILRYYEVGRLRLKETGVTRQVSYGEWYLLDDGNTPDFWRIRFHSVSEYRVLEPVEIIADTAKTEEEVTECH